MVESHQWFLLLYKTENIDFAAVLFLVNPCSQLQITSNQVTEQKAHKVTETLFIELHLATCHYIKSEN